MKNVIKNNQGTALLVALLVMGVLIAISLSLSVLILRETRITKDLLDSGKAYYAAESGIEVAMYNLKNELPGWETDEKKYKPLKLGGDRAVAEYKVDNTCNSYPCFDAGFNSTGAPASAYYDYLELNETITIPLFVVKNGQTVEAKNFVVQYYVAFNPALDLKLQGDLSSWDVLRWKIFGLYKQGDMVSQSTESISDFTAVSTSLNSKTGTEGQTNANTPTWFGTLQECHNGIPGYYPQGITCLVYDTKNIEKITMVGEEAVSFTGNCTAEEAREYYNYHGGKELVEDDIKDCYLIKTFLDTHAYKYLTLTNLMNPAVFKDKAYSNKDILSRLYFRVVVEGETPREYADIIANGYSGSVKQSINVKMQRGSFMPVFNFALYSTYDDPDTKN